jgi:hypothetical protein
MKIFQTSYTLCLDFGVTLFQIRLDSVFRAVAADARDEHAPVAPVA